jgi:hypothetical protein
MVGDKERKHKIPEAFNLVCFLQAIDPSALCFVLEEIVPYLPVPKKRLKALNPAQICFGRRAAFLCLITSST